MPVALHHIQRYAKTSRETPGITRAIFLNCVCSFIYTRTCSAGLGVMTLLDRPFADFVQRNHNGATDVISRNIDPFGAEYSFGVLAAFYLEGSVFDSLKARAVAQDGLAASLIASGFITPTLK